MVKVLLYGYCVGVALSRWIAQRLHEDIAFRVLAANNTPDFRTISDFRKDNLAELSDLFLSASGRTGIVPVGWAGEVGACGVGRDQGQDQRIEAPGDELRADAGEDGAVGGGGGGVAAGMMQNRPRPKAGSTRGCPTTRPSATLPMLSPGSCPRRVGGISCRRTTVKRWWTAPTR